MKINRIKSIDELIIKLSNLRPDKKMSPLIKEYKDLREKGYSTTLIVMYFTDKYLVKNGDKYKS